jgi:hypothetical protein
MIMEIAVQWHIYICVYVHRNISITLRVLVCRFDIRQISHLVQRILYKSPPGIGTHSIKVASPWGECNPILFSYLHLTPFTISIFRSNRYPILLGGQRQCGFKSCPRILYMTGVPGIELQTSFHYVYHVTACYVIIKAEEDKQSCKCPAKTYQQHSRYLQSTSAYQALMWHLQSEQQDFIADNFPHRRNNKLGKHQLLNVWQYAMMMMMLLMF